MDRRSLEAGLREDNLWCQAKLDLIDFFLSQAFRPVPSQDKKVLSVGVGSGDDLGLMQRCGTRNVKNILQSEAGL